MVCMVIKFLGSLNMNHFPSHVLNKGYRQEVYTDWISKCRTQIFGEAVMMNSGFILMPYSSFN